MEDNQCIKKVIEWGPRANRRGRGRPQTRLSDDEQKQLYNTRTISKPASHRKKNVGH